MSTVKQEKYFYGNLPPKNIAELKPWYLVHSELIRSYSKSIKQQQSDCAMIKNTVSLTWMTMIEPTTCWFENFGILMYNLGKVMGGNDEYIDKSYTRVSQLFKNTWLSRYPHPHTVVFHNGSEFKWDFNPFLKDLDIKSVLTTIKNPQANASVEWVHKVIYNMHFTKDPDNNLFDYIYMGWKPIIYSIENKGLLSPHYTVHTIPSCLWQRHDIKTCITSRPVSYKHS